VAAAGLHGLQALFDPPAGYDMNEFLYGRLVIQGCKLFLVKALYNIVRSMCLLGERRNSGIVGYRSRVVRRLRCIGHWVHLIP